MRATIRSTLALAVAVPLLGAALVAAAQTPVRGGTLRVGWIPGAKTLDPHFSVQFPERFVLYLVCNTLVGLDRSFNVVPELARSWQIAPDGKRVTFHLQPGVKFHDGTDLTALTNRPGFIVSPSAVKQLGDGYGRSPVCTGPFRFVEWIADSRVTVERFPDYWEKGKPY